MNEQAADAVLLHDRLTGVTAMLDLCRATANCIRNNLLWALAYNVTSQYPLAVPLVCIFACAHACVSVVCVCLSVCASIRDMRMRAMTTGNRNAYRCRRSSCAPRPSASPLAVLRSVELPRPSAATLTAAIADLCRLRLRPCSRTCLRCVALSSATDALWSAVFVLALCLCSVVSTLCDKRISPWLTLSHSWRRRDDERIDAGSRRKLSFACSPLLPVTRDTGSTVASRHRSIFATAATTPSLGKTRSSDRMHTHPPPTFLCVVF